MSRPGCQNTLKGWHKFFLVPALQAGVVDGSLFLKQGFALFLSCKSLSGFGNQIQVGFFVYSD